MSKAPGRKASQGDLFGAGKAEPEPRPEPAPAAAREPGPKLAAKTAPKTAAEDAPRAAPVRERQILSVGDLTRQIKGTLESGFPRVLVRGEVSGFRGPNVRGHLYFSLKDKEACLDTKVWASTAARMKFRLREGMEVVAEGSVDVYEPQGRYSLIASRLEPVGEGALAVAFAQLKERLQAEGLFGERRVRPLRPVPFLPRRIGVVTSITGAALRDFLRVLHTRHPRLSVLVADARVQGEGSAREVVRGIERLSRTDVDVIVLTRGGGSVEDLWTFNEEAVARAIFACPVPVVSAIGHEVDFTISDFVADLRCPTPSAAAERLSPVLRELEVGLGTWEGRLRKAVAHHLLADRQRLERLHGRLGDPTRALGQRRLHLSNKAESLARCTRRAVAARRDGLRALSERLGRHHPQAELRQKREALQKLAQRLRAAAQEGLRKKAQPLEKGRAALWRASPAARVHGWRRRLGERRARVEALVTRRLSHERRTLHGMAAKLDAMSPLSVMARGYAVTFRKEDGQLVRRASDVKPGDALSIRLSPDGKGTEDIAAVVTDPAS